MQTGPLFHSMTTQTCQKWRARVVVAGSSATSGLEISTVSHPIANLGATWWLHACAFH